jgi:hypothetical protein
MEYGARGVLIPLGKKRNFLEVSSDTVERLELVSFSDPTKVVGMT